MYTNETKFEIKIMLFSGNKSCPDGGWKDFDGSFDSIEECIKYLEEKYVDWAHVVINGQKLIEGQKNFRKKKPIWEFNENRAQ